MNLYDIVIEKEQHEKIESSLKEKIVILRNRLEKLTTNYTKEKITGGTPTDTNEIYHKIIEAEKKLEHIISLKENCIKTIDELEDVFKKGKERNKLIYVEFRYKKYSADKVGMRYGITKRQVYRIISEIEKECIKKRARN